MIRLEQLAAALGLPLRHSSGDETITHLSSIASARSSSLVFATDVSTVKAALQSEASATILPSQLAAETGAGKAALLSANPRLDFARAARFLKPERQSTGIHPTAVVDTSAIVPASASVGACAVIGAAATIGEGSIIGEGAVLAAGVTIGVDCHIYPRVVVYAGTTLGDRVVVHAGAVLGSDGYGYVRDPATGEYLQFPQQGRLLIEDDVEIGANTTIDRGALDATVLRRGAKLDNLIHIGHNCVLGRNVLIAAQTGLSGSITIGDNAVLGGQIGIGDHAHIGEGVILGSQAGVLPGKKLRATGGILWGTPAQPVEHILKELALLRKLRKSAKPEGEG